MRQKHKVFGGETVKIETLLQRVRARARVCVRLLLCVYVRMCVCENVCVCECVCVCKTRREYL